MGPEQALAALEAKVLESAGVGSWLRTVETLRALLTSGSPDINALVLAMGEPAVEAQLLDALGKAFELGANEARLVVDNVELAKTATLPKSVAAFTEGLDKAGREAMAKAQALARAGVDPEAVLAPIFGHANTVKRSVTSGVNKAGNEGTLAVAAVEGRSTVWVAETNACVHCLAYSGRTAAAGKDYPGGLTYGRKSYFPDAINSPPRHPHCRCTLEPLVSQEYADALRREADRSVLRGFSLESESMAVRIDAADRLVASDPNAPKSVIAYAKKSIKDGKFPTRGRPLDGPTTPGKGPGFPPNKPPSAPPKGKPPAPAPRAPSPELPRLRQDLAELERDRKMFEPLGGRPLSPRMAKLAKLHDEKIAAAREKVAVEELGGATPKLDALPKRKPSSIAEIVTDANPGRATRVYDNNCTNAVVAAELRTRGYDVVAAPRPNRTGRPVGESAEGWRDESGALRPFTTGLKADEVNKIVDSWPEGSRGFVSGQWRGNKDGHIFTVEKVDGKPVYHEPQIPDSAVNGGADHLGRMAPGKINILRVDDLTPTDTLAGYVEHDTPKLRDALAVKAAQKAAVKAEMDAIKAKIDAIDVTSPPMDGTNETREIRLSKVLARNALAKEFNTMRTKWMRL